MMESAFNIWLLIAAIAVGLVFIGAIGLVIFRVMVANNSQHAQNQEIRQQFGAFTEERETQSLGHDPENTNRLS